MIKYLVPLYAVVLLNIIPYQGYASEKIAFYNMKEIMRNYDLGKIRSSEFQIRQEEYNAKIKDAEAELRRSKDFIENNRSSLAKDELNKLISEHQSKYKNYEKLVETANDDLASLQETLFSSLIQDIMKIIDQIKGKELYTLVLNKAEAGELYTKDKDITDIIMDKYKKKPPEVGSTVDSPNQQMKLPSTTRQKMSSNSRAGAAVKMKNLPDPSDGLGPLGKTWTIGYQPPPFQRMRATSHGPYAVHGIMDNWSALKLIYSDSSRDIYIESDAIEITRIPPGSLPGFGNISWRNLFGYVQKGGPFYATVVIDYKDKKILDAIARSLRGIPHPELLRYRVEQVSLDIPNNEMAYAAISLADKDGDMVAMNGLLNKAWDNKIVVPLNESPSFMEIAESIAAVMDKANRDPKIADTISELIERNAAIEKKVKSDQKISDEKSEFFGGTFDKSITRSGYIAYRNNKFGYQIDYPQEFTRSKSAQVDKFTFHSKDNKAVLVLVGGENRGTTLMQCYDDNIKGSVGDGEIIRKSINENWFEITWRSKIDGIRYLSYSKMYVGNKNGSA
ncbi:MAG: OmpH family outer membrane protein, partial [Deltaproteobacteria bacterium]|nr:OmpH family outer membrane protein [Deltaproteobacteria bacterium]